VDISLVRRGDVTGPLFEELGGFMAARNAEPAQHIGYVGDEAADVTAELRELEGAFAFALGRGGDGRLTGVLGGEWDHDIGRVLVYGPWADGPDQMDRLYATLQPALPVDIGERELFCDAANAGVIAFAGRHGFARRGEHVIMRFPRDRVAELPPVTLDALDPALHDQLAALHHHAFPSTRAPLPVLLAAGQPIRVVAEGRTLLGYAALKLRPEHGDAKIDYLAVVEEARGRGVGTRLLAGALREVFADDRYDHVRLITSNPVARRLYEKVGFTLQQELRSFRTARTT